MPTKENKLRLFETVLSSPGMNDSIKLDLRVSRKNVLLICHLAEAGLASEKGTGDELLDSLNDASVKDLKSLSDELLNKAGLSEFYEKLKQL